MDLHTAGHRRGIAAAPHHAAAEAGRAILAEGGNALEAMVAMAATIAAVYPHMNHIGGDGFWLVREPSGRVRALMGAGPAGAKATPALYREHGHDTIPPRGPLAALTVPGAIATWMLALEGAKAHRGRLPLDVLLGAAIKHAQGYTVTRSQARLTAEKLAECKDAPGFAATFLVDGKPPAEGATLEAGGARRDARSTRQCGPGGFLSRRCRARDRRRSGEHRLAGDARRSRKIRGGGARAALRRAAIRHALQHAAADAGARLADDPRAVRAAARGGSRELRSRARPRRSDQARASACATASSPIPSGSSDPPARYLEKSFLDTEAAQDRPPQGRALAGAARRRRHDLDGRGGFLRPRRVLHPVALLGVRLGLRAAAHRRADAEPRRELLAREGRREPAAARPQAVPHAQSGARGAARRPRHGLRRDGRRRPAAVAGGAVHAPRSLSRAAGGGGRPAALAARPHLGLVAHQSAARVRAFPKG